MKCMLLFSWFLICTSSLPAQELTTKETKVVFVVNSISHEIIHLDLFDVISAYDKTDLKQRFPGCKFYLGILEGSYEIVDDGGIKPVRNSILTLYTATPLWEADSFLETKALKPGGTLHLGSASKSEIITFKEGLITLKTL